MIYLASRSPRRCQLLDQIQLKYQQIEIEVDETPYAQELPENYVKRLALTKAQAGRLKYSTTYPILAADTIIVYQNQILTKPIDKNHAKQILNLLSGHQHQVMTAVALVTDIEQVCLNRSQVYFRQLTTAEIEAYVATGEPLDKAGAYAIQGLASIFIKRIEGSYSSIMGLPLYETTLLLNKVGIHIPMTLLK